MVNDTHSTQRVGNPHRGLTITWWAAIEQTHSGQRVNKYIVDRGLTIHIVDRGLTIQTGG